MAVSAPFLHISSSASHLRPSAPIPISPTPSLPFLSCCHGQDHVFPLASSAAPSPFTERHSFWRVRGGGRLQLDGINGDDDQHVLSSCQEGSCNVASRPLEPCELRHGRPAPSFQENNTDTRSRLQGLRDHQCLQAFSFQRGQSSIMCQLPDLCELVKLLHKRQETDQMMQKSIGNVFLVGTGPGDPELLTLKALSLMQKADLVLYDRLVSTDILDMVHAGAVLLYVGKGAGYHTRTQDEIHQILLSFAVAGATILRLKGGDPLVFGRGGEEMDFLHQRGIEVKIVPGITAASGIAAELGIPLTHRGFANSVQFLTGHVTKGGNGFHLSDQTANPESTLVIYMGLATISLLSSKLIADGLPSNTPAVAVERGTTPQQRTVFAKLESLANEVASAHLASPTLLIIGRVVALSPSWPYRPSTAEHRRFIAPVPAC